MAILGAMQSAAIRLVGQRPVAFFGSPNVFEMEICDLANEVAKDIVASADWQGLTSLHTITGDGATEEFDLPSDYDRQLVNSEVQDTESWAWGYYHFTDYNEFVYERNRGFTLWPGGWIIVGGKMQFSPAPADGSSAVFPYIRNTYAIDSGTLSGKSAFDADTDGFVLPERLLTLGLVWRWREQKKLDFTGDQEAFAKAMSEYASKDKGSTVIRKGSRLPLRGTSYAWPWELG